MARSARQAKRPVAEQRPLHGGAAALGGLIMRNPTVVGGSTAFLVALFYVSANALWYQPHAHLGAFFATRDFVRAPGSSAADAEPETTFLIERPEPAPRKIPSDPVTAQVQRILQELNFYSGTVDGLAGPATTKAIQAYQQKVGLTVSGRIDDDLLEQLGAQPTTAGIMPTPAPRPAVQAAPQAEAEAEVDGQKALNMKIQAGLKAFGNEGMGIDGVIGTRTKAAIREFQALFGLPQTGEPDEALYAKMKEIGLTN